MLRTHSAADSRFTAKGRPVFLHLPKASNSALPSYLNDHTLDNIASEDTRSVYTYICGCILERFVPSGDCTLEICTSHGRLRLVR